MIERILASRWWLLLGAVLAVGGWTVAVAWQASTWTELDSATVVPLGAPIEAQGKTVAVLTDLDQPGRSIVCSSVAPDGTRTAIPAAPIARQVVSEGVTWHLLAVAGKGTDAMAIECVADDGQLDSAVYGVALLDGFETRSGTAIGWGTSVAALLIAVATTAVRLRVRSKAPSAL